MRKDGKTQSIELDSSASGHPTFLSRPVSFQYGFSVTSMITASSFPDSVSFYLSTFSITFDLFISFL